MKVFRSNEGDPFPLHWYKKCTRGLEKKLTNAELEAMKFEGDRIEADGRCKTYERQLTLCLDKLDKLEKKNGQRNQS